MQTFLLITSDATVLQAYLDREKKKYGITPWGYEEIHPELSIGIGEVRSIKASYKFKPLDGINRMVVLFDCEKATIEAQQALLKILEEPPQNTYIYLVTKNSSLLLPTIVSRSQVITLDTPQKNVVSKDSTALDTIYKVCKSSKGARILMAQTFATGRDEAIVFLEEMNKVLSGQLIAQTPSKLSLLQIADLITKTNATIRFLNGNINVKATLDVFFLGFPHLPDKSLISGS